MTNSQSLVLSLYRSLGVRRGGFPRSLVPSFPCSLPLSHLIRRRSITSRNLCAQQPQVNSQLRAVMHKVTHHPRPPNPILGVVDPRLRSSNELPIFIPLL